ncbi:MFS transporter, partial [bacterium]
MITRSRWGKWSLSRTASSLRYRNFRLLFLGTVVSNTGDFMQAMAQSWLVWIMTGSPFLLGLIGFSQALPRLLLGAIGGAIVDRLDRRRLLVVTQNLAMVQASVFWALVYFGLINFWHIFFLVLFLGTVNTLNQTARQSLINSLVPREELMNAIALNSSVVNLSKVIGPSLGGVLISIIGVDGCLLVNAISFLAIIFSLLMMDLPPWQREKGDDNFWQEVSEGYTYIKTNSRVFSVLSLAYIVALIGSPYSRFLPIFASDILHTGPSGFGFLLAAPGLGAVISALCLASMGNIRRRGNFTFFSVFAFSSFLILFSFSRSMSLSLLCLVMVGSTHIAFRAMANTIIQTETPPHLLGRILSLFLMDKGL